MKEFDKSFTLLYLYVRKSAQMGETLKHKFAAQAVLIELFIICCIAIASSASVIGFAFFYNILYGILLSTLVPILFLMKKGESFAAVGIKKLGSRQYILIIIAVCFSIGGQLIPLILKGAVIRVDLLSICILPLVMTTFFEEFLFRGLIQTRIEIQYGWPAAIVLSGLFFSVYHIGYPGFRNISDLLLLFAVGLFFSISFKLSGNNLFVSYFVNLPNAFVTYILKSEQFPVFTWVSSVFAGITIILIAFILVFTIKKQKIRIS